jgi:hypothetical protein
VAVTLSWCVKMRDQVRSRGRRTMLRVGPGYGIDTLLAVIALILAILALAGLFTPLTMLEIAVILLALAILL